MINVEKTKKEKSNEAVLIYPHQLFEDSPILNNLNKEALIYIIEEPLMFTQYKFHKQKLVLHRASMRFYKNFLTQKGYAVKYIESKSIQKTEDIFDFLQKDKITKVSFYDLVDDWLHKKLIKKLEIENIECEIFDTPLFLTNKEDLDSFFLPLIKNNKKLLMFNFYKHQRKRLNILIENDGSPAGGKWSYDEDNRKKLPKDIKLPKNPLPIKSEEIIKAKKYVDKNFPKNYGSHELFFYPTNFDEAKSWLDSFLKEKLNSFGPYEDAVSSEHDFIFHSILSPLLNTGLLTPQYVIDQTLNYAKKHKIKLSSLEGFIRQIIGWREYIRAVYVYLGVKERNGNYFNSNREIPESFWKGDTGIEPIDETIKTVLKYSYSHHIPRLMIMGNFMNLCQFKPDEVYKWFMEMYIDAYDWVMVPNVYSMALYADGGLITTKPYISGSAYIIKMSDYKKGEWSDIWDSLFWNFIDNHYYLLSKEGRLGFLGLTYNKMSKEKKDEYKKRASIFLNNL